MMNQQLQKHALLQATTRRNRPSNTSACKALIMLMNLKFIPWRISPTPNDRGRQGSGTHYDLTGLGFQRSPTLNHGLRKGKYPLTYLGSNFDV